MESELGIFQTRAESLLEKLPVGLSGCEIEHVADGVSTDVFRIKKGRESFYFRITPQGENFSPEAIAHELLLKKGVIVPKVLYFEDFNEELGRSFMIVSEIKGAPLKADRDSKQSQGVAQKAGEQLALINSIPIAGFGWVDRSKKNVRKIEATGDDYHDFVLNRLDGMLTSLVDQTIITGSLSKNISLVVSRNEHYFDYDQAYLAHGDFDASHIYQHEGKYTGIIDFGDIRATSPYHDLAHFETYSGELFRHLLEGYKSVRRLPEDYVHRISLEGLVFAVGKLWWTAKNRPHKLKGHAAMKYIDKSLKVLR